MANKLRNNLIYIKFEKNICVFAKTSKRRKLYYLQSKGKNILILTLFL